MSQWDLHNLASPPLILNTHQTVFSPTARKNIFDGDETAYYDLDVSFFNDVAYTPNGRFLLVASDENTHAWPTISRLLEISCTEVQRNLTWDEWQRYIPGEPYRATCPNLPPDSAAPEITEN